MDHRDVGHINGKQLKVFNRSSRRLSRGEENAVALIGLRMASESRRWVAGEPHEVSVVSIMNRVFDNPRLISNMIFISWFKRIGIKKLVRSRNQARGTWFQVPNNLDGREVSLGDPRPGTCWEILVKPEVLYEAMKLYADNKWHQGAIDTVTHGAALADLEKTIEELVAEEKSHTPKGDAVTGSHSILGSPEGHQDSETGTGTMGQDGCLQAAPPARNPHIAAEGLAMEQPLATPERVFERYDANKSWWMSPAEPAVVPPVCQDPQCPHCEDEAEQAPQVVYSVWDETPVRKIDVPPEARGWDEED